MWWTQQGEPDFWKLCGRHEDKGIVHSFFFWWRMKSLFNEVLREVKCVGHSQFGLLDFFFNFCLMAACSCHIWMRLTAEVYCGILLALGILSWPRQDLIFIFMYKSCLYSWQLYRFADLKVVSWFWNMFLSVFEVQVVPQLVGFIPGVFSLSVCCSFFLVWSQYGRILMSEKWWFLYGQPNDTYHKTLLNSITSSLW